ncbi:MAG TPA: hypothetical protein VGB82_07495 [Alphaproteobacteria bacterium]
MEESLGSRSLHTDARLASSADVIVIASLWALVAVLLAVIAIEPMLTGAPAAC